MLNYIHGPCCKYNKPEAVQVQIPSKTSDFNLIGTDKDDEWYYAYMLL